MEHAARNTNASMKTCDVSESALQKNPNQNKKKKQGLDLR